MVLVLVREACILDHHCFLFLSQYILYPTPNVGFELLKIGATVRWQLLDTNCEVVGCQKTLLNVMNYKLLEVLQAN